MVAVTLANVPLPVGDGVKERMTLYPVFAWAIIFGIYLASGDRKVNRR